MKMRIALFLLLSILSVRADSVPTNTYPYTITAVLSQFRVCLKKSYVFTPPTKEEIKFATEQGLTAQPHYHVDMTRLCELSAGIDTSKCPDDFVIAWGQTVLACGKMGKGKPNAKALKDFAVFASTFYGNPAGVSGGLALAGDASSAAEPRSDAANASCQAFLKMRQVCSSYGIKI